MKKYLNSTQASGVAPYLADQPLPALESASPPKDSTMRGDAADKAPLRPLPEDALVIVPLRETVVFPHTVVPLAIGRARSQVATQQAVKQERPVGVLLQTKPDVDEPRPDDLHWVGTSVAVMRYLTGPDGTHHVIARGLRRFRVLQFLDGWPFPVAQVQYIDDPDRADPEIEGRARALKARSLETLALVPQVPAEMTTALQEMNSPAQLADVVASVIDVPVAEKQSLLETFDLQSRLDRLLEAVTHRLQVLKVSRDVADRTRENMGDLNRKYLLREQMRVIQKELGEDEGNTAEIAEIDAAIAEAGMPEEVEKAARKELKRLERMSEGAAEYSMVRTYLDWLVELPWKAEPAEPIDIGEARRILDADHFGLEKIKRRILEYLAVHKLNPGGRSPILCFVGPPGVGKTSLGQSIAKATGRAFARVALGGVHDESEIRGHRRTYIGALPGNIIQALRKAGTNRCVMMLDEIDKLGSGGAHGDPSAALLEVLDPEQNANFRDTYLAVPYDLSKVMFVCTANMLDSIPGPLRDRMEVIQLPGYTTQEKLQIARRYLVQRQMDAAGLKAEQIAITDEALEAIISGYTREAGVRNLEREIGSVCRHVAVRIAEGAEGCSQGRAEPSPAPEGGKETRGGPAFPCDRITVDAGDLQAILGGRRFESEVAMRTGVPGVATGLAWTPVGGEILFIEATRTPGNGKLILTGQLGDVMKESVQAALSLVKGRASTLGIDIDGFDKSDIHVHVPAGATPKDGPSAGVAMFTALTSLFSGRPVRADIAMTGEISLRGLVLPVGGIKEKVLAAQRAGITTVMLPARNQRDLEDIPEDVRAQMRFVWLERVDEAIETALEAEAALVGG